MPSGRPTAEGEAPAYLHHYRIERPLAEGGMGKVYLGYDTALERPVALKVVRPDIAALPGFSERFLREARSQARVSHSNVVQVYFVGQAGHIWFMAMELVDGGTLEEILVRKERLSWGDTVRHWLGLAEGLREAARLGIVHRDIKPANILLDRFGLAHLADFGLALPTGARDGIIPEDSPIPEADRLTKVGSVMGTPHYISPEQARGEPLDTRADLYSLAASFYELLCGEPAVPAISIDEAQTFHRRTRPRPIRDKAPNVPRALARIVDRCLAPLADHRYSDYDELLRDLRAAAPRPLVPARAPQRLLAWALDLAVPLEVARLTIQYVSLLAFVVLALWFCVGAMLLGATPGQWLVRAQLRTCDDTDVRFPRVVARFLIQHGWLLPASLAVAGVYNSDMGNLVSLLAAVAAAWLLLVALGSLLALGSRGLALHDRFTRSRVLLDIR